MVAAAVNNYTSCCSGLAPKLFDEKPQAEPQVAAFADLAPKLLDRNPRPEPRAAAFANRRPQPVRRYAQPTVGSSEDSDDFVDLVFDYVKEEDEDMDYATVLELSGDNYNSGGCCFGGLRASLKDACGGD